MKSISELKGSITPLVTPFTGTDAEKVDEEAVERLVEFQISNGSHGVSCVGSTGEPLSLSTAEKLRVIELVVSSAAGRVPVLAGTGSHSLSDTLFLSKKALELGADALLVVTPFYSKPSQAGLVEYFSRVASSVDAPVVIYNIPGRTAVNVEPATQRLIQERNPNVVGVKEANFDFGQVSRDIDVCGPEWRVYSGIELLCYPLLALGGKGYVSATANVVPAKVARVFDLVEEGNFLEAQRLHFELLRLNEALFVESNPGPVKFIMELMGLCEGQLRLPLTPISAKHAKQVRAVAESYGLLDNVLSR